MRLILEDLLVGVNMDLDDFAKLSISHLIAICFCVFCVCATVAIGIHAFAHPINSIHDDCILRELHHNGTFNNKKEK